MLDGMVNMMSFVPAQGRADVCVTYVDLMVDQLQLIIPTSRTVFMMPNLGVWCDLSRNCK